MSDMSDAPPAPAAPRELSAREVEIYDRQLRLWGVETQQRMATSVALVAGCASGLAAETAKNLVLTGIGVVLADARAGRPGEARFVSGFVWDEGRRLGAGSGARGDGGLAPTHAAVAVHLLQQQRLLRIDEPPLLPNMPVLPVP